MMKYAGLMLQLECIRIGCYNAFILVVTMHSHSLLSGKYLEGEGKSLQAVFSGAWCLGYK